MGHSRTASSTSNVKCLRPKSGLGSHSGTASSIHILSFPPVSSLLTLTPLRCSDMELMSPERATGNGSGKRSQAVGTRESLPPHTQRKNSDVSECQNLSGYTMSLKLFIHSVTHTHTQSMFACLRTYVYIWKPEANLGSLPYLLSIHRGKTQLNPELANCARLASQLSPEGGGHLYPFS